MIVFEKWMGCEEVKTFKLKGLEIVENKEEEVIQTTVPLVDGLVINREDSGGWLIEAYLEQSQRAFLQELKDNKNEIMIQVKITKESNDPAFFITSIIGINEIDENRINALFQGDVVDVRKSKIEEMLQTIIEEGYQGASLLKKFKELI
ncbi:YwpF family protein [Virgibacillus sp. W0181]|uniref:YwpF family protein n=1 Tax=Virgibacillus sp. W0181 TaxID=3391581 RepID=UPI003F47041C